MNQIHLIKRSQRTSQTSLSADHDNELWTWASERKKRTFEKIDPPLKAKTPLWSKLITPFSRLTY